MPFSSLALFSSSRFCFSHGFLFLPQVPTYLFCFTFILPSITSYSMTEAGGHPFVTFIHVFSSIGQQATVESSSCCTQLSIATFVIDTHTHTCRWFQSHVPCASRPKRQSAQAASHVVRGHCGWSTAGLGISFPCLGQGYKVASVVPCGLGGDAVSGRGGGGCGWGGRCQSTDRPERVVWLAFALIDRARPPRCCASSVGSEGCTRTNPEMMGSDGVAGQDARVKQRTGPSRTGMVKPAQPADRSIALEHLKTGWFIFPSTGPGHTHTEPSRSVPTLVAGPHGETSMSYSAH